VRPPRGARVNAPVTDDAHTRRRAGVTSAAWLLPALVIAHLALKLALLPRAIDAPLQGDEAAYFDAAKALSNMVRDLVGLGPLDRAELADNVVGNGWFMPGMAVVLTPLLLVDPDPGLAAVRLYLGLVTLMLYALGLRAVDRTFGRPWTLVLLVVPGLVPVWLLYSFSAWGDLSAGLVAVLLVCRVTEAARILVGGHPLPVGHGVAIGLLGACVLYLRSSTLPLALGMLVLVLLGALLLARRGSRRCSVVAAAAAGLSFATLVAPWSVAASAALDGRVLTTSTVPISTAVAFGDVDELCFGPCGEGNIWYASVAYSQTVARATGAGELEVQAQMSERALRGATASGVAADVLDNLDRYALEPSGFEPVFREVPGSPPDTVSAVVTRTTDLAYFAALLVAAGALLVVPVRSARLLLSGLVLKLGLLALFTQPFLHIGSARYWPVYLPLAALLLGWGWQVARRTRDDIGSSALRRWLVGLHVAVLVGVLGVAIGLGALAASAP
jgi:hypothetical protein